MGEIVYFPDTLQTPLEGTLFAINSEGEFDVSESAPISGASASLRLGETEQIVFVSTPRQVLLHLRQRELSTFSRGNSPLESFTIESRRTMKGFFRVRYDKETSTATYAKIRAILDDPSYHTPEMCELLRLIPYEELNQFGIASLKSIVK